jgi:hypothetical protein
MTFVSLCTEEPESESTRVVARPGCRNTWGNRGSNSQGTLPAGLLPSEALHNHANHHAHRLPQTRRATGVFGGEKVIDGWLILKLSHHPGQGWAVVMNLGFLHTTLSAFVIEKAEHSIERLLQVIQHVNERPALTVMKKIVAGDG